MTQHGDGACKNVPWGNALETAIDRDQSINADTVGRVVERVSVKVFKNNGTDYWGRLRTGSALLLYGVGFIPASSGLSVFFRAGE